MILNALAFTLGVAVIAAILLISGVAIHVLVGNREWKTLRMIATVVGTLIGIFLLRLSHLQNSW